MMCKAPKIQKAHKIRMAPNRKQITHLIKACGVARFAYNWALTEWANQYKQGLKPSAYKLNAIFNSIKREQFPFVMDVTKCAAQQAILNLGVSFNNFFRDIKKGLKGKKAGYPRYKKRGIHDSFYLANNVFQVSGKKIRIPKLGWVKLREPLRFEGKILSGTVSRAADQWHISILVEQEIEEPKAQGPVIGVDVGIKTLITTSDNQRFENSKVLKYYTSKLRRLQKSLSRKQKGSGRYKKAKLALSRCYLKITNIRKDSIHKATAAITKSCGILGIEDLNVAGMMKNHHIARAMSDSSLSEIHRQLIYKSLWKGVRIVRADRFYPSSKMCSRCGSVKSDLKLSDREYICDCGLRIDRDLNAAINLRNMAAGSAVPARGDGSSGFNFIETKLLSMKREINTKVYNFG